MLSGTTSALGCNAAATISHLISKILQETQVAIELIIVYDGSTDGTSSIVRSIHDERLILLEQKNQGVYATRNAALATHHGEWVISSMPMMILQTVSLICDGRSLQRRKAMW